jgi:hypothetical protein
VSLIQKEYFRLDEVARDLGLSGSDVIYLAENGCLRLSILVYDLPLERGAIEDPGNGDWHRVPEEAGRWTGLLDLWEKDAHVILKTGHAEISAFHAAKGRYCDCIGATAIVPVTQLDLLVRLAERQRLERVLKSTSGGAASPEPRAAIGFVHTPDYRIVQLGSETFSLGPYQAGVVLAGRPWCRGVDILAEIECSTLRMSDLFKSKRGWRRLIESNSRGMYRLAVTARD